MDYNEIKSVALSYADRQDAEVTTSVDSFLRIVESRINQRVKVGDMVVISQLRTQNGVQFYGVPEDFGGIRSISYYPETASFGKNLEYLNPKQLSDVLLRSNESDSSKYYAIVAGQLQIVPPPANGILDISYYRKIPPLTASNSENWLSKAHPELYIFGVMVEISAFVKDKEATQLWEARFTSEIDNLEMNDELTRWSGTPLRIRSEEF